MTTLISHIKVFILDLELVRKLLICCRKLKFLGNYENLRRVKLKKASLLIQNGDVMVSSFSSPPQAKFFISYR